MCGGVGWGLEVLAPPAGLQVGPQGLGLGAIHQGSGPGPVLWVLAGSLPRWEGRPTLEAAGTADRVRPLFPHQSRWPLSLCRWEEPMQGVVGDWGPCLQVFLVLGELLLSCNWAVVADILLVRVGAGPRAS